MNVDLLGPIGGQSLNQRQARFEIGLVDGNRHCPAHHGQLSDVNIGERVSAIDGDIWNDAIGTAMLENFEDFRMGRDAGDAIGNLRHSWWKGLENLFKGGQRHMSAHFFIPFLVAFITVMDQCVFGEIIFTWKAVEIVDLS